MKTLKSIFTLMVLLFASHSMAQSAAVASIQTFKIYAHSSTASKLVSMELIKLNKYTVLDHFDTQEVPDVAKYDSCFAKQCLIEYGQALETDYIFSGSIEKLSGKIIITIKMIDVKNKSVQKTMSEQFSDNESELQRMIRVTLQKMHGIEPDPELYRQLKFNEEVITSKNTGRINNSGPRMGVAYSHGSIEEFLTRSENRGGLDIAPVFSNIGFQFEAQYVGTENFSAIFEFIPSLNALEQGKFLPSFAILNGFRFGKQGWEFAFGPNFGFTKRSDGFFDHDGIYDSSPGGYGKYWSRQDLQSAGFDYSDSAIKENGYLYTPTSDLRGDLKLSTRWLMAFGRTFSSGALNIPVNVFYSSVKKGGMMGVSVGFNIIRSKKTLN
ncbi:MAG: TolB-like protein [Arenicella sp.]|jgi:TolB-like protein